MSLLLLAGITLSVSVGQVRVEVWAVWRIAAYHLLGLGEPTWTPVQDDIVWNLSFPRALLGVIVGAGLSLVGVMTQAMVRNPLADSFVLGISQGASVGAVAFIVLGSGVLGVSGTSSAGFIGALAAFALVYTLARAAGAMNPQGLVLAGIAVGYGFHSIVNFLLLLANNPAQTNTALFWLIGSLGAARWSLLAVPACVVAAGGWMLIVLAGRLNALIVGDETATTSGIHVERLRRGLFTLASLVTCVVVSVSGSIGFVGLIVPHALRLVVGGEHRRLIPVLAVGGAAFLVWADVAARIILAPRELPIGVVTGVAGAPLFVGLLLRHREVGGGR